MLIVKKSDIIEKNKEVILTSNSKDNHQLSVQMLQTDCLVSNTYLGELLDLSVPQFLHL